MKKADITHTDEVTKEMKAVGEQDQAFDFPSLGISVVAKSLSEALEKAKEIIKAKK